MSVNTTTLPSGMKIVTHEMPHLESVAIGVWVRSGSRNENNSQHGISHLLEHMAFKGTIRRSARQIVEEIESVGGDLNAATSVEHTSYYAHVLKENVPLALDILSDILLNSKFDEAELKRERHVILQEIGSSLDHPEEVVFDAFRDTAYAKQPIGRPILGTEATINAFTNNDLRKYLSENYRPQDIVISAAGALDHQNFANHATEAFAPLKDQGNSKPEQQPAKYLGGASIKDKDLMETHVLMGFEGIAYSHENYYKAQLLSGILGGGMASRLFQEVRESRGLCYSIYSFHWGFSDSGMFGIYAATGEEDLPTLVPVVLDELLKICDSISSQEMDRARAQVRAGLLMSLESSTSRAAQIARQTMLFGRVHDLAELVDRINGYSAKDLSNLAQSIFLNSEPTLAAFGHTKAAESKLNLDAIKSHLGSHLA